MSATPPLTGLERSVARTVRACPLSHRLTSVAGSIASVAAAVSVAGWADGVCAQTAGDFSPPPLPPLVQTDTTPNNPAPPVQITASPPANAPSPAVDAQPQAAAAPANTSVDSLPPLQLGPNGAREVQTQLIALGFNPGRADGQVGPATIAAAQKYHESRGGSGEVAMDGTLLTRLRQDTGPRLTPEQVAARSQPRPPAASSSPASAIQHFGARLRALFNGG